MMNLIAHPPESKYHPLVVGVNDCPRVIFALTGGVTCVPIEGTKTFRVKAEIDAKTADRLTSLEIDVMQCLRRQGKDWFRDETYSPEDHLVPAVTWAKRGTEAKLLTDGAWPEGLSSVYAYVGHLIVSETGLKLVWSLSKDHAVTADTDGVDDDVDDEAINELTTKVDETFKAVTAALGTDDKLDILCQLR